METAKQPTTAVAIQLTQKPVIVHALAEVGRNVTARLEALNLENQVATVDTVKSLKELRAELNKELADYEIQRKFVKEGVSAPYLEFEAVYKEEISEKYKQAIETLKNKIESVEIKIKDEKKANVVSYFNELCQLEKIDFLKFDNVGIEINLSTTEKAYMQKCGEFVQKVVDDIALINSEQFQAEMMVEYKKTLNASQAITTVRKRKDDEKTEQDRIAMAETQRRGTELRKLGMFYSDLTKTFNWVKDENIFIKQSDIDGLSKEEFSTKVIEIESKIKAATVLEPIINPEFNLADTVKTPVQPLAAPVVVTTTVKEEDVEASFCVTCSMTKLTDLVNYMKTNSITYKPIE